jgi:hypothetical protein
LTRFLYDGVSYSSVTKKIPVILDKLARLESIIRELPGYRLYASSLLILYDGETAIKNGEPRGGEPQSANRNGSDYPKRTLEEGHNNAALELKIVDFANCVTGEDGLPANARCPPHHPLDIDRGYLRGLRTLRIYFQRILKEINDENFVERDEAEAMALEPRTARGESTTSGYWEGVVMENDSGEVSE